MSDLREKLAARIKGPNCAYPLDNEDWLAVADECIRQMEWARKEHGLDAAVWWKSPQMRSLTLAPDDWSPDETPCPLIKGATDAQHEDVSAEGDVAEL